MDVYTIDQTLDSVRLLKRKFNSEAPHVFAMTWIAWEQLQFRVVKVVAKLDGWNISLIEKALALDSNSGRPRSAEKLIQNLTKVNPHDFPGLAGETWRSINEFSHLRNKFFHGSYRAKPSDYENAFEYMFPLVENVGWLSDVRLKHISNQPKLGNVYRDLRAGGNSPMRIQNIDELLERLGISLSN